MTGSKIVSVVLLSLAVSACGGSGGDEKEAATQNLVNAALNVTEEAENTVDAASNVASVAVAAKTAAKYVGKYPFDKVDGHSWDSDPAIKAAITAAVPNAKILDTVLNGAGPATPIVQKDGKILSWACEQHNCGPHNWSVLIDAQSGAAEVCYYDDGFDAKQARWFVGGKEVRRTGDCPSGEGA